MMNDTAHKQLVAEFNHRKGQTALLLEAFKRHGELTTRDLHRLGTGCSSRLFELRKEGWQIVASRMEPGLFKYTFKGHKDDEKPFSWRAYNRRRREAE